MGSTLTRQGKSPGARSLHWSIVPIVFSYRVFCIMGDGESAEGSIWEAASFAGHYKLDNLVAIFDVNRLGQSEPAALQHQVETYRQRMESFGYVSIVINTTYM